MPGLVASFEICDTDLIVREQSSQLKKEKKKKTTKMLATHSRVPTGSRDEGMFLSAEPLPLVATDCNEHKNT